MTENMISFRYDDETEQALQEIVAELQRRLESRMVNRSDAIRYAIETAAINIEQEKANNIMV